MGLDRRPRRHHLHAAPGLRGAPPPDILEMSRSASVEVMVHPAFPEEYEPLQSPGCVDALRQLPTGTFANL